MTKLVITILFMVFHFPANAYFYNLDCNANYQPEVGKDTQSSNMASKDLSSEAFGDVQFAVELIGMKYEVLWHKEFDTFYMKILDGDRKVLFSTSRVPTFEHNDTVADTTLSDGTRRWISCSYIPKEN